MTRYPTHPWSYIVSFFREFGENYPEFAPLGDAVAEIAQSRYAAGLHPVQSHRTLLLYQHDHAGPEDEQVRLDWEDGEFVVRYLNGSTRDPRLALVPPKGIWTKRGPDAMPLLERAFHHLRWFVEYRTPAV